MKKMTNTKKPFGEEYSEALNAVNNKRKEQLVDAERENMAANIRTLYKTKWSEQREEKRVKNIKKLKDQIQENSDILNNNEIERMYEDGRKKPKSTDEIREIYKKKYGGK